ncbi:MAG: UDP-N-acetylmuramate dehydrogenase, partial [Kiritimatiellia bacterium]
MPLSAPTTRALLAYDIEPKMDEPLHRRTYWRVGGPADGWLRVPDVDTLRAVARACSQTQCALFILGNGSNLLVSDRGVRGLVVQLTGAVAHIDADDRAPPML